MKEVLLWAAILVVHLVKAEAEAEAEPGLGNYYNNYFFPGRSYGRQYGSYWSRNGKALNQFPFAQQASLARPTANPQQQLQQEQQQLSRRAAQERISFPQLPQQRFQSQQRQFSPRLPTLNSQRQAQANSQFITDSSLSSALERHAQALKDHEARVQAQLALMGQPSPQAQVHPGFQTTSRQVIHPGNQVLDKFQDHASKRPVVIQEPVQQPQPVQQVPETYQEPKFKVVSRPRSFQHQQTQDHHHHVANHDHQSHPGAIPHVAPKLVEHHPDPHHLGHQEPHQLGRQEPHHLGHQEPHHLGHQEPHHLGHLEPHHVGHQDLGPPPALETNHNSFNPRARQPLVQEPIHVHHEAIDAKPDYLVGPVHPPELTIGVIAKAAERCVDKIEYVEEIVEDEEIECHHTYDKQCQTSYTTDFEAQQEEECEETFEKNCFIEYKKVAMNETVEVCHTPLVKDCNVPGPVECKTEYESMCETRYHEHNVVDDIPDCIEVKEYKCQLVEKGYSAEEECKEWPVQKCNVRSELVKKVTPETKCFKVPKKLCAPSGCGFVQAPEECIQKKETTIQEVPEETCDLKPHKECKHVTKLVPTLKPVEECTDVPKEICAKKKSPPIKVKKPVTKKWCYTPSPGSE